MVKASLSDGVTKSVSIKVKTKFSEDTKKRDYSNSYDTVYEKLGKANEAGKSYYGICDDDTKNNCEVHTRDLCFKSPSCYYN